MVNDVSIISKNEFMLGKEHKLLEKLINYKNKLEIQKKKNKEETKKIILQKKKIILNVWII